MSKKLFRNWRINLIKSILVLVIISVSMMANTVKASETDSTNKYVYFGSYIQSLVTDTEEISILSKTEFKNNKATIQGIKYAYKDGKYFKEQPIEWTILEDSGECYTLLSKDVIDQHNFDDWQEFWSTSGIRTWLNSDFINIAFTATEQNDIAVTNVPNLESDYDNNPNGGKPYDVITNDKVYLLSYYDLTDDTYGLLEESSRVAYSSEFVNTSKSAIVYWLRGPRKWSYGLKQGYYVNANGSIGTWYTTYSYGIRPVIRVNKNAKGLSYEKPEEKKLINPKKVTSEITYLAMSELAYCECSPTNGKTIKESGDLEKYIKKQASSPDSFIPNTYLNLTNKQFIEMLFEYIEDWKIVNVYSDSESGFYAIALECGNEHVLAIRGSQDISKYKNLKTDWADNLTYGLNEQCSRQMKKAISIAMADKEQSNGKKYSVTGHSLGGGLAMMVGNYLDVNTVAFDGSPTTDVSYYQMSEQMTKCFRGVDTWKSVDYINEHCPVGVLDKGYKNYISLMDRHNTLNPFDAHQRWAIVDYILDELELSPIVSSNNFNSGSTIKKDMLLGTGTIYLGSNSSDILKSSLKGLIHRDVMYGGYGDDKLYGNNGDDILSGGLGDDTLDGGTGNDKYLYWKGQGLDTIIDVSGNDQLNLYGYDSNDQFTIVDTSEYKLIKYYDDNIIKIRKKRGVTNVSNSFVVNIYDSNLNKINEIKLQEWNTWKNSKTYTFACPVKVQVFDKNNDKVLELENELLEPIYTDYGYFYVNNEDGELVKHIIIEEEYSVKIVATDNGTMDFYAEKDDGQKFESIYAENIEISKSDIFEVYNQDKVKLFNGNKEISLSEISNIRAYELNVESSNIELMIGNSSLINASLVPLNSNETINYISSNPEIAIVDKSGNVKAMAEGECEIGVYTSGGLTTNVSVKVKKIEESTTDKDNNKVTTNDKTTTSSLKTQKITTAKVKVIKAKKLKKKSVKFKLKAKTDGKGKITYKVISTPKKMKKFIKVSKKGVVTLKKMTKKGRYKIRITAAAKGNYMKTTKTITIKVK